MELKPTESELEVLQVMWEKQPCTVRDVHEELVNTKDVGYTSTLKLMQIMFDKGLVDRDTSARSHLYTALISRGDAQSTAINKIIDTVFNGSGADLVIKALGGSIASKTEIDKIKNFLNQFDEPEE